MRTKHRRAASRGSNFQSLESRRLLAAFGSPWPEARSLSISFPADDTKFGGIANDIRSTFDAVTDRENWQELALRAFQTWSIHADLNVGLRNDFDLDFGTPGLSVGDPRFGDFRIGALPQTGLVANSLPFQAAAGTYSGDIVLNSNETFTYHDWANDVGPDPATQSAGDRDLYSVLLHETGNALGLGDNMLESTVMFGQYTTPKGLLTQDDIDRIQALYGARTDPYESVGNDQLQVASLIPTPVGFDPDSDLISTRGSLLNSADVDYHEIVPQSGRSDVTIRLRTAGISLLQSRLQVLDEFGNVLAETESTSVFDNNHQIQVGSLANHSVLYFRVSAAADDGYAVGDYELEVDYRPASVQAADPVAGAYDSGVDTILTNFALLDEEVGTNDVVSDAESLIASPIFSAGNRYEFQSSVGSATDVDVWKVTAPSDLNGRLLVHLAAVGSEQADLNVHLVDADGQGVGARGRLTQDGTWVLEVAEPVANADYYLRVSVDPSSPVQIGNYLASAEFTAPSEQMNHLITSDLDSTVDEFIRWTAVEPKLYRFDLKVQGASAQEGVLLTIYDAFTREIRGVVRATSDVTRTAFTFLEEGEYTLRFSTFSRSDVPVSQINYSLWVDGLSDDQDTDGDGVDDGSNYYYYYYYDPDDDYTEPSGYYYYYYYYYSSGY